MWGSIKQLAVIACVIAAVNGYSISFPSPGGDMTPQAACHVNWKVLTVHKTVPKHCH